MASLDDRLRLTLLTELRHAKDRLSRVTVTHRQQAIDISAIAATIERLFVQLDNTYVRPSPWRQPEGGGQ
jgi:hypothetical protein